ncbi:hypothetical protein [Treponema sp.]|uniref:hypothetical protein n=1 Tax=Treponema sp. TaxID=166 RepID=UPI003FD7EE86
MSSFSDGYSFFVKNVVGGNVGSVHGDKYVGNVEEKIAKLTKNMKNFEGFKTGSDKLKGDIAEYWHADTHNIDAALKGKKVNAEVLRSHGLGSVDVQVEDKGYSLKYYKEGAASAKQQAKSFYERYREYLSQTQKTEGDISFEQYLKNSNVKDADIEKIMHAALYGNQGRLISTEQLEQARNFLRRKIAEESMKRPELVQKYQETLDMLTDRIKSSKGTESIPLTEAEAKNLADLAKEGKFDPKEFGLGSKELIKDKYIFDEALKAGMSAAVISAVLSAAPEIYKMIEQLIDSGKIDKDDLLGSGGKILSASSEAFLKGGISAALTITCEAGKLGNLAKSLDPSIIGAATVLALNTVKYSIKLTMGKMTKGELADACIRDMFLMSSSVALGMVLQAIMPELPVFGYMLGSFIGSMVGTFIYNSGHKVLMSFCVESGFTFFGIVDQNYRLPDAVLQQIGVKTLQYDRMETKTLELKTLEMKTIETKQIETKRINLVFVRRGVIGVNKIGYV